MSNIEPSEESDIKFHRPPLSPQVSSPSSSYRRNSYCDASDSPSIRRSSTSDSNYNFPSFSSSLRRASAKYDPHQSPDMSRGHSLARTGSSNDSPGNRPETSVNLYRYSSVHEETPDWGFRSLRRRNSRMGPSSKHYENDNVKY